MEDNLIENEKGILFPIDKNICLRKVLNITDTLEILSGKWRVPILILLTFEPKRFSELSKELKKITDRTLSKELKDLETNMLISKILTDDSYQTAKYSITEHGISLTKVLLELRKWGQIHREKIFLNH